MDRAAANKMASSQSSTSTTRSISMGTPSGRLVTPTAERACTPRSPKTSPSKFEHPLRTDGSAVNESGQAMYPLTLTTRFTLSRSPTTPFSEAMSLRPEKKYARKDERRNRTCGFDVRESALKACDFCEIARLLRRELDTDPSRMQRLHVLLEGQMTRRVDPVPLLDRQGVRAHGLRQRGEGVTKLLDARLRVNGAAREADGWQQGWATHV